MGRKDYQEYEPRGFSSKGPREDIEIKSILTDITQLPMFKDIDIKKFSDEKGYADLLAEKVCRKIKTSQIRKIFGEIKDIEKELVGGGSWKSIETDFYQLKPRLAHAKGRKLIPDEFYDVIKISLNKVDVGTDIERKENFKMFVKFLEAVVAYHKYHGGN